MTERKGEMLSIQTMEEVLHNSMIPYAEYVIMDRAIPRVEDGLKPVQRRILYTMMELGLTPDKPQRKSARIVGDCLGKFHPHGDSSVYNAMVRMAQPWAQRGLLVHGHGNFGSIDGDGAAAMRYTEAKLAPLAMELLRDIDKDTIDFQNNFDDSMLEPSVLPGRYPNLLVNGASGIAVGLATNIPPHNISEVISGVCAYIKNKDITLSEMMKYIKGPDFPTGGYILPESLEEAYKTGNGRIKIRAKVHVENGDGGKKNIVVTEIPFQVNKSTMMQKINILKEDKTSVFAGISDIVDESDENIRIVLKLRKDVDTKPLLEQLFIKSELQVGFSFNMVAIAGGKPRTLSLLDIIRYYVDYQIQVVVRRTKFDLANAKERAHILQGLMIAVANIDEVIAIIKKSQNSRVARVGLQERFSLSERQAQAILDMRLARITSLEVFKLEEELSELTNKIAMLEGILASETRQHEVVAEEMLQIKKAYGEARRSVIVGNEDEALTIEDPSDAPTNFAIGVTPLGTIKRMAKKDFAKYKASIAKGGVEEAGIFSCEIESESAEILYCFTSLGKCYKFQPKDVPVATQKAKGSKISHIIPSFAEGDKILRICELSEEPVGEFVFFTKQGMAKRSEKKDYLLLKNAFDAIKLRDGDEVVSVCDFDEKKTAVFVSAKGMVLNARTDDVPIQGRISSGVRGMNVEEGDEVVFAGLCSRVGEIILVTDSAMAKRVVLSTIEPLARYRKGVKIFDLKGNARIIFASYVKMPYDIAVIADTKEIKIVNSEELEVERRETRGSRLEVNFFEKLVSCVPFI